MTQALVVVALTFLSVDLARRLAAHKGRARAAWMWSAALLGPLPLVVLAVLPSRPRLSN
jgi:NO-binding membrane sensor protein with MHYT domain